MKTNAAFTDGRVISNCPKCKEHSIGHFDDDNWDGDDYWIEMTCFNCLAKFIFTINASVTLSNPEEIIK